MKINTYTTLHCAAADVVGHQVQSPFWPHALLLALKVSWVPPLQ